MVTSKSTFKSLYAGVFTVILLVVFSTSALSPKPNFSGLWKVDSLKSNFGRFMSAVKLKIDQTTDTISIEPTMRTGQGETRSLVNKLPLGKTMTETRGTTKSIISTEWSGQALVQKSLFQDVTHNSKYQATETWTLSPDRMTLTIDRLIEDDGDGGHGTCKAVYHRNSR